MAVIQKEDWAMFIVDDRKEGGSIIFGREKAGGVSVAFGGTDKNPQGIEYVLDAAETDVLRRLLNRRIER